MSRILSLGVSLGALCALAAATTAASAADLSTPYNPPPAAAYSPVPAADWTGPYAGLTGGYAFGGGTATNNGFLGGVYLGMNYQTQSNWVFGAEGDLTLTGKSGGGISNPWNTTFRGRVGYTTGSMLIYGTGGLAVGQLKSTAPSQSSTKVGWTAGLGVEAQLTQNVVGRVEYRHTNLGTFPTSGSAYTSNDIMVGVGFKF
jgi:outer membrane immunogenic protein